LFFAKGVRSQIRTVPICVFPAFSVGALADRGKSSSREGKTAEVVFEKTSRSFGVRNSTSPTYGEKSFGKKPLERNNFGDPQRGRVLFGVGMVFNMGKELGNHRNMDDRRAK